ncbi:hypothetical protein ACSBR1_007191 [Camellia fascicularis]
MSSPRRRHWWCFQSEKREEAVVAWNLITNSAFFDMMMLRFEQDIKVGFTEYMRSDGSRSYFFCLDTVRDLFVDAGFTEYLDLGYNYDLKCENLVWLSHLSLLSHLDLSCVNLSKAVDWVQSINNLPLLQEVRLFACILPDITTHPSLPFNSSVSLSMLDLSYNDISSSIYGWLFNFSSSLVDVDLSSNQLKGLIPDSFGGMISLTNLCLSFNHLEGGLPKSFANVFIAAGEQLLVARVSMQIAIAMATATNNADRERERGGWRWVSNRNRDRKERERAIEQIVIRFQIAIAMVVVTGGDDGALVR